MIYIKDANFPYPVLSSTSNSYIENDFDLDVIISENGDDYQFDFNYQINSEFIKKLLKENKAQLILILQTKDNKFYKLEPGQAKVMIPKLRISINSRTSIQIHIQALENINFSENRDLSSFYNQFKAELNVQKFNLLGYSDVVVFEGSFKRPYDLFEKQVDENLLSDIKIELGSETIIIHYKYPDYQFNDLPKTSALNHAYIYMGLTKALQAFINNNSDSNDRDIYLSDLDDPTSLLDIKLYNLLKSKNVKELNEDNIDEVIYKISDKIIEKFTNAVRGLEAHED